MKKKENVTGLEMQPGALLRLREYVCRSEEPTPYPLDIAILELNRTDSEAVIHLRGKTIRKCPFCGLVHDAIEEYLWVELSHLQCTCGSSNQKILLTGIKAVDQESQIYDFEAQIICKDCNRFWPRTLKRLHNIFTGVKKLRISVVNGEAELELRDNK